LGSAPIAKADPPPPTISEPEAPPDDVARARAEFLKGTALVRDAQWAEALAAFERSAAIKSHPATTYNIAACQRSMGQYTKARGTLEHALAEDKAAGGVLAPDVVREIGELERDLDHLLARATITLKPETASIAVDGRPLEVVDADTHHPVLAAGVRAVGPGEPPPTATFDVVVDPGTHVITVSRKGFTDAVVNQTFLPGAVVAVPLELSQLPAVLHVAADQERAIVTVNGMDVGEAPVDVRRSAGTYVVRVRKDGYLPYETRVAVAAGDEPVLRATLPVRKPPLTEKWWFWTAAGVGVTGAVLGVYVATRPEPTRPAVDGGSLGWAKPIQ
jgi:hypothetical protein